MHKNAAVRPSRARRGALSWARNAVLNATYNALGHLSKKRQGLSKKRARPQATWPLPAIPRPLPDEAQRPADPAAVRRTISHLLDDAMFTNIWRRTPDEQPYNLSLIHI